MKNEQDALAARYERYWRSGSPPPQSDPLASQRRRHLWNLIDQLGGGKATNILDVGCGAGELLAEAHERGMRPVGMDVAEAAVGRARARLREAPLYTHSIEDLPWPVEEGAFDFVASFEVIEHLLEPQALLEGARLALKPGGYLALTTPFHGRVKNLAIAAFGFERHFDVNGDHIRFFNDASLSRMLLECGFEQPLLTHLGRGWPIWENTFAWVPRGE